MFERVAIIGLGLIGGSMAAGIRKQKQDVSIVAFDPDPASLKHALASGLIDEACESALQAASNAGLVIVASPVMAMESVFAELRDVLRDGGTIVTDVGSVKGCVIDAARAAAEGAVPRFVPGHPIAGSEQHGVTAANPDLFVNHRVILTPMEETDAAALTSVRELWQAIGAEVVEMEAAHHDSVLAQTSHLPHLLAYALVDTLSSGGDSMEVFEYAAGGFRDFSRIAASDPVMWRDIFKTNAVPVLEALDEFRERLDEMRLLIEEGRTDELAEILARSKAARDHFSQLIEARGQQEKK